VIKAAALLQMIFADGHKPVRKVGRSMYGTGHAVSHPSSKVASGIVRARSPLMADGLLHLDTDPNVVRMSPYPMSVFYWSTNGDETSVKREHIPDMAIKRGDGTVVFLDYVSSVEQAATPRFQLRVAERLRHFGEEFGCGYQVLDERTIRIEPRLSNVRLMWTHRERETEPRSLSHAREALRRTPLPNTIRAVSENADISRQAISWAGEDLPTAVDETNLVFTAVMQLAMRGDVLLDLGRPLTLDSTIHEVTK